MLVRTTLLSVLHFVASTTALGLYNVSRQGFELITKKNDIALVAFVSPSSDSSKALQAEWRIVAAQTEEPSLVTIDCTAEVDLCSENDVVSLPAIRLFRNQKSVDRYRGPRKASEILSYIRRSKLPAISRLHSSNITSFKAGDDHVFIAYLGPGDADLSSIFEGLAARNRHRFTFGITSDVRLATAENVPVPSIIGYETSDGEQQTFSGEWQLKALESFVERTTAPLIGEMTRRNEMRYLQAGRSILYVFAETSDERSHYQLLLKPLAKKYKEYINFVTIDAVEYAHMAPGLGLESGSFPALALQNPMFGQAFPFDAKIEVSEEKVEKWVLDIVGGRVKPWGAEVGAGGKGPARDEL